MKKKKQKKEKLYAIGLTMTKNLGFGSFSILSCVGCIRAKSKKKARASFLREAILMNPNHTAKGLPTIKKIPKNF